MHVVIMQCLFCHAVVYATTANGVCLHLLVPPLTQYILLLQHKWVGVLLGEKHPLQPLHSKKGSGLTYFRWWAYFQLWAYFREIMVYGKLGECRTLWGEREQAMHYSIDCYVAKALPMKYQITAHGSFMHGM